MANVFLALPTYGATEPALIQAVMRASKVHEVMISTQRFSILTYNFNVLWCEALNMRKAEALEYFCLLHSDIDPEPYWLDKLIAEQQRTRVDVLSAVIAIKDEEGETSTAIWHEPEGVAVRMSLAEVWDQPTPTFKIDDENRTLLVNSGMILVDLSKEWVERIHWHQDDTIERTKEGKFEALTMPEDWGFSLDAQRLGASVMATRAIDVGHIGRKRYGNRNPNGSGEGIKLKP